MITIKIKDRSKPTDSHQWIIVAFYHNDDDEPVHEEAFTWSEDDTEKSILSSIEIVKQKVENRLNKVDENVIVQRIDNFVSKHRDAIKLPRLDMGDMN